MTRPHARTVLFTLAVAAGAVLVWPAGPAEVIAQPPKPASPTPADKTFEHKITPFLNKYCNTCHNSDKQSGGLALDVYLSEAHARKDRKTWQAIEKAIAAGEMPPKKKAQPTKDEKEFVIGWIETALTKIDCTAPKDPGRVTLRRLNRAEYNNTIRDLCGVDFKPADDFPADDVGYGFDNIGDVLSVQPILVEKYMTAADNVLTSAIPSLDPVPSAKQLYRPQNIQVVPRGSRKRERDARGREVVKIAMTQEGAAFLEKFNFPADGEYVVRVKAWGQSAGGEVPQLAVRVDGKDVKTFAVAFPEARPQTYEVKAAVKAGERRVAAAFVNPSADAEPGKGRILGLDTIEVEGPLGGGVRPLPPSAKLILGRPLEQHEDKARFAESVLTDFARRAYRRPAKPDEIRRLMRLYTLAVSQGEPFDRAVKLPMKAVLVSPHFLFRIEDDPKEPDGVRTLSDHELTTRLSYFLWSSMPDAELAGAADRGDLRKPGVLAAQVKRMLADPKSKALVENFAEQWLTLRNLKTTAPDPVSFPAWDDALREAMLKETHLFFEHVIRTDRSVLDFLDSDYTFVNERLAKHYGVPNVRGPEFRQVKMPDGRRGGVLTQASVLTVTSNPTRTSPVKRGKWVLENIFGTPPPPPAPDVPELPPTAELKGTLRQQMEQHRADPSCATCHSKLDPLGFGLENFDAIGGWRTLDNKQPIDASGVLPGGETFDGPAGLRKILLGKQEQFRRALSEKLLTFALGRGLEYYDKCVVDEIAAKLVKGRDTFSALVLAVAESDAFQKRRGKRDE